MMKGKKFLAFLLSAMLAAGTLQLPVTAAENTEAKSEIVTETAAEDLSEGAVEEDDAEDLCSETDAEQNSSSENEISADFEAEEESGDAAAGEDLDGKDAEPAEEAADNDAEEEDALEEEADLSEDAPVLEEDPSSPTDGAATRPSDSVSPADEPAAQPSDPVSATDGPAIQAGQEEAVSGLEEENSVSGPEQEDSASGREQEKPDFRTGESADDPAGENIPDEVSVEAEKEAESGSIEPGQGNFEALYVMPGEGQRITGPEGADADDLFAEYFQHALYPEGDETGSAKDEDDLDSVSTPGKNAAIRMNAVEETIYHRIAAEIVKVAAGQRASTIFEIPVTEMGLDRTEWTAAQLGVSSLFEDEGIAQDAIDAVNSKASFDLGRILDALLGKHPYEMYWYDKTAGCYITGYGMFVDYRDDLEDYVIGITGDIRIYMEVAPAYSDGEYTVDCEIGQSVQTTIDNAASIVEAYADVTDYEKLRGYLTTICDLVSYNWDAVNENMHYGNPWQIIWVFDNDPSTNVVCEGYSKAFQYLCDRTDFKSSRIECISVSGMMLDETGGGGHMWNVVRMDDGNNYLVDVTNCDEGSVGEPDQLFLIGRSETDPEGSPENGYVFYPSEIEITYQYDPELLSVYALEDLILSDSDYQNNGQSHDDPGDPGSNIVDSGTCGDKLTWTLDEDGVLTIDGIGDMYDYPGINEGGTPWIDYRDRIQQIIIGGSVTGIGSNAFCYLKNVTEIPIPESVERIGAHAFVQCSKLESISIPSNIKTIQNGLFECCYALKSVEIPYGVTSIGGNAFYYCESLTGIEIPESVTEIGGQAFGGCCSLKSVSLPDGIDQIMQGSFNGCTSLSEIVIPDGVTNIGVYAFYCCESLTEIVIPDGVLSIGDCAFHSCTGLRTITIPVSVTAIGEDAFGNCNSLEEINYLGSEEQFYAIDIPDLSYDMISKVKCANKIVSLEGASVEINNSESPEAAYSGEPITPEVTVKAGDKTLTEGTDYTLSYENNTNAGIATVTVTGTGNYIGTLTRTFTINAADIADAAVTGIAAKTYTGAALTQSPTVKVGDRILTKGTDYTLSYANNTNAGTATVTIRGTGNYSGTLSKTFTIRAASIAGAAVTGITAKTYTGAALTQSPTVKVGDKTLTKGTDYTLSYANNTNAGTATVKITGKGNYTGTKSASFTISKAAQSITAKASAASVAVGRTATVSITGARGTKSFKSSDTTIATVTSAGTVTARKVGTVRITATSAATTNYKAASKTVTIKVVPAATASLTAANQATGIKLTWKKVAGATGYRVYRGSTLLKVITSGSTLTYTDAKANTNGAKYTFKVIATASTGISTLSKSVAYYRIARPAISSATNSAAGRATVKWGKNATATGYQIQYSLSSSFASGNKTITLKGASTVSKVITSLTKGKTYYIRMRTFKTVGSTNYWSLWSPVKSVKISK